MHPKLQHYVPQSYLRNFATKAKKGYLVFCFDKFTRKTFKPNIKNVASQTKFYDFKDSNGNEFSIEESLSTIEEEAGKAFQDLIETPTISTVLLHKEILAHFFAVQDSRTQAFRDAQNDVIKSANEKFQEFGFSFPVPTEDEEKEFQARFLVETKSQTANILMNMKWVLVTNPTTRPFWTSDNPIVKHNPVDPPVKGMGNLGLLCMGIQLYIPISPRLLIILCDPRAYPDQKLEVIAQPTNIDFNNSGQVLQSKQHIFSVDDDFELAQKIIEENPNISNPNHPRIITYANEKLKSQKRA